MAAALAATSAQAGTASANLSVQVNLVRPGVQSPAVPVDPARPGAVSNASYCLSATLSEQTGAQVRVVCSTGEFVSIEPRENQPFAGTHAAAWRFISNLRDTGEPASGSLGRGTSAVSVTRLHLFDVAQRSDALEMLVSF